MTRETRIQRVFQDLMGVIDLHEQPGDHVSTTLTAKLAEWIVDREDAERLARRDRFAAAALTGMWSSGLLTAADTRERLAEEAFHVADAMETARAKD